jgi:hypothetical protein
MKINRCFYLLLPGLLICFIRADCVSIAVQTDPPVQTDKKIYSATLTPESFQVAIKWTYTNRTSAAVYLGKGHTLLILEKKVEDEWIAARRDAIPFSEEENAKPLRISLEEFSRINPGETREGTWNIRPVKGSILGPGSTAKRRVELKEVPGLYRIVIALSSTEYGGDNSAEWLPQEECVSNEFKIVEKE